jgi:hypothetical protein
MPRGIGGRRETGRVSDLPPETPDVTIRHFCIAVSCLVLLTCVAYYVSQTGWAAPPRPLCGTWTAHRACLLPRHKCEPPTRNALTVTQ